MQVVVGLGNPGTQYASTRHNVGFDVVALLARQHRADAWRSRGHARTCRARIGAQVVLLVQPQSYMNCSGEPVGVLLRYHRLDAGALTVVHDELDFEPGVVRIKHGGGHGGHNGLRSLMAHVPGEFTRVRVGIGKPPPGRAGADWVLSRFDGGARRAVDDACIDAANAVEAILRDGVAAASNRLNRR